MERLLLLLVKPCFLFGLHGLSLTDPAPWLLGCVSLPAVSSGDCTPDPQSGPSLASSLPVARCFPSRASPKPTFRASAGPALTAPGLPAASTHSVPPGAKCCLLSYDHCFTKRFLSVYILSFHCIFFLLICYILFVVCCFLVSPLKRVGVIWDMLTARVITLFKQPNAAHGAGLSLTRALLLFVGTKSTKPIGDWLCCSTLTNVWRLGVRMPSKRW